MRILSMIAGSALMIAYALHPAAVSAKKFQVYSHPDAIAAPTKDVAVKDLQPSQAPSELENIVGQTADKPKTKPAKPKTSTRKKTTPAAPAPAKEAEIEVVEEVPVPEPVAPLTIIPPPSELELASNDSEHSGYLYRARIWALKWQELVDVGVMIGAFLLVWQLTSVTRRQYAVLKRSVSAAETAAAAAQQSAEAAQLSSLMQTSLERPYVFIEPNIQGSVGGANNKEEPAQFTIKFSFRNHGKTPAVIADLQVSGSYWSTGYPDALYAASHTASQGMVMSPGDKSSPFTLVFSIDVDDLEKAYNGDGQLLFWGKLLYRDMFGEMRETAFCRSYNFDDKAFRMADADKLNYHT